MRLPRKALEFIENNEGAIFAYAFLCLVVLLLVFPVREFDQDLRSMKPHSTNMDIGIAATAYGGEEFANVYINAPAKSVVIMLDGKCLTITREEIERRAR
jgi:hypothetical protein